jgi:RHS repeat-associated protein
MRALSCVSSTYCVAGDNMGHVLTYNGTSWSSAVLIDSGKMLNALSCTSTSFCVAVDGAGRQLTYNGTSWSTASDIDGTNVLSAISCTTATSCEATDQSGNVLAYNGTWGSPDDIDGTALLHGISCPTTVFCAISEAMGHVLTFNGATQVSAQLAWDRTGTLPVVQSDGTNYYIYGDSSEPVEQVNVTSSPPASNPVFLTYAASDSTWLATNTAGQQVAFYGYDAFGALAFGTPDSPFGYAGQYADTSANPSGLDNMRARLYNPQTGGFTTRDPAFAETDEAYAYAGGDPVNGSDPSGTCPIEDWLAPALYLDCLAATEAGHLWDAAGSQAPQSEPIICPKAAQASGDAAGFAATQVNSFFSVTLGGAGTWQLPALQLAQEIAISTSGAVEIIWIDQFGGNAGGWGSYSSQNALLMAGIASSTAWMDWIMKITTANFFAGSVKLALDSIVTKAASYGLSGAASYLLGKSLGFVLPSPNSTPIPTAK